MKPELTLNAAKQIASKKRNARVSDFLTEEEKRKLHDASMHRQKKAKKRFDDVDAYVAEIIARFGYDAYKDWNAGIIDNEKMAKMLLAERAREKKHLLALEGIIIAMISPMIKREKGEPKPKSPKLAVKIFQNEAQSARGESPS